MKSFSVARFTNEGFVDDHDHIAIEQSLRIDLVYGALHNRSTHQLTTIMRTPGDDDKLAIGLLFSLGIIESKDDILDIVPCLRSRFDDDANPRITIYLQAHKTFHPLDFFEGYPRYSSCGVCGGHNLPSCKISHENSAPPFSMSAKILTTLSDRLSRRQTIFNKTGGVHAVGLFTKDGDDVVVFEDVGRHNALDKVIGQVLLESFASENCILLLSSRASFEMVQKAAVAKIPLIAAMGAVSSHAITLADQCNITLVGFLRNERFNVYTHQERVCL